MSFFDAGEEGGLYNVESFPAPGRGGKISPEVEKKKLSYAA